MDSLSRRAFCALAGLGTLTATHSPGAATSPSTQSADPSTADVVVTSQHELETAFESLSAGDTIYITGRNAPYRTTEWLDIDVDNVTILGDRTQPLIKPRSDAAVGGIRIGHHSQCQQITVSGVGYRGTVTPNQSAERLHGITVRNAQHVTLTNNTIAHTLPIAHNNGGSGISIGPTAAHLSLLNNRITEYGDRGIQLGGTNLLVAGNHISTGLDRAISCDLWTVERTNHAATNTILVGNICGNSAEGSLIGISRNTGPLSIHQNLKYTTYPGTIAVIGNLGFGYHKSFCHIRSPIALQHLTIQQNISRHTTDGLTTDTTAFSGIAVDVSKSRRITLRQNELYNYSRHGIAVTNTYSGKGLTLSRRLSDLTIEGNRLVTPSDTGLSVAGLDASSISHNRIAGATTGISLTDNSTLAVHDNYFRNIGGSAVTVTNPSQNTGHDFADNYIEAYNQGETSSPAIHVDARGLRIQDTTIRDGSADAPAVSESNKASQNVYQGNWARGESPWQFQSATSTVQDNTPPVDTHHGVTATDGNPLTISFEKPYQRPPPLSFGRGWTRIQNLAFQTSDDAYTGLTLTVEQPSQPLDVFVTH